MSAPSVWILPSGLGLRATQGNLEIRFKPDAPWLVLATNDHLHELRVVIDCIDDERVLEEEEWSHERLSNSGRSIAALARVLEEALKAGRDAGV